MNKLLILLLCLGISIIQAQCLLEIKSERSASNYYFNIEEDFVKCISPSFFLTFGFSYKTLLISPNIKDCELITYQRDRNYYAVKQNYNYITDYADIKYKFFFLAIPVGIGYNISRKYSINYNANYNYLFDCKIFNTSTARTEFLDKESLPKEYFLEDGFGALNKHSVSHQFGIYYRNRYGYKFGLVYSIYPRVIQSKTYNYMFMNMLKSQSAISGISFSVIKTLGTLIKKKKNII